MTIDNKIAVVAIVTPVVLTLAAYALDWQGQKDEKLHKLDKLIERQSTILEMQIQFNEELEKGRVYVPYHKLQPNNSGNSGNSDDN